MSDKENADGREAMIVREAALSKRNLAVGTKQQGRCLKARTIHWRLHLVKMQIPLNGESLN